MDKANRVAAGEAAEAHVQEEIRKAQEMLKSRGVESVLFNNRIVEFLSVYGRNGKMTTEIDHIVVTPYRIFCFETKSTVYKSMDDEFWRLADGRKTANPDHQNHLHKQVLCEYLGVDPEKVVTIECLTGYDYRPVEPYYPNDYVLYGNDLADDLALLMWTGGTEIEYEAVISKIQETGTSAYAKERHQEILDEAMEKMHWIRKREKAGVFKLTDVIRCPRCGDMLVLKKCPCYNAKKRKMEDGYVLGCRQYEGRGKGCQGLIYADSEPGKGFKMCKRTEETENEKETDYMTVYDEYYAMKGEIVKLKEENSRYSASSRSFAKRLDEREKKITELEGQVRKLQEELAGRRTLWERFAGLTKK